MGTIQNNLNAMLGTAAGVATLSEHVSNQKKELEIKKLETEKEVFNAENAVKENTEAIAHQMVLEGNDEGLLPKEGETPAQAEQRAVDEYLEAQSVAAEDKYQEQMMRVKNPLTSKRVAMARKAAIEKQDAQNARRNLKFDFEIASKKLEALGGKK